MADENDEKRRPGRPRDEDPRRNKYTIRLRDDDAAILGEIAATRGLSETALAQELVERQLKRLGKRKE